MTSALWNNLLEAFGETMLAGVTFVTLFSIGVRTLGTNRGNTAQPPGSTAQASGGTPQPPGSTAGEAVNVSEAGAVLCFVLCFVIVVLGVYLAATK
jgi:hypothetical protein